MCREWAGQSPQDISSSLGRGFDPRPPHQVSAFSPTPDFACRFESIGYPLHAGDPNGAVALIRFRTGVDEGDA